MCEVLGVEIIKVLILFTYEVLDVFFDSLFCLAEVKSLSI